MDAPNNTLPQRHSRRSCFVISAEGGIDELSPGTAEQDARAEQWSEAEKIAGSAMNRLGASEASPKGAYQG